MTMSHCGFNLLTLMMAATLSTTLALHKVRGPDYRALSAVEKQRLVWENIRSNTSEAEWGRMKLWEVLLWPARPTYEDEGDELPANRRKLLHSGGGCVGKVELVLKNPSTNNYTGLFKKASHGIIRISTGVDPKSNSEFKLSDQNIIPGMAIKFFRDKAESGSLLAMYYILGQDSRNIFANSWSNHQPPLKGALKILVGAKLATGSPHFQQLGLSDFASISQDGTRVPEANINFPYKLIFRPTGEFMFPDEDHGPINDDLMSIPKGSVLWNVFAWDQPEALNGKESYLGDVVLRSRLVTSDWGDRRLFFKHQDMLEDLALRPEWVPHTQRWALFD